jgi:phosphonate transport system ATP-binding protein
MIVIKVQWPSPSVAAVPLSQSPRIVVSELTKHYARALALDHVSVTIEPGEFVAVIGRSGAGKTTLLRCLSGAVPVSEGAIRVGGGDIGPLRGARLQAHRARVGMVFQQFNLVKRLRVVDNVLIGRLPHLRGWRRWTALAWQFNAAEREIALRCLAHVGLLERTWQRADTLSGGQQQRVAIAKILAQSPALILADEPIASLDVANAAVVMDTLRRVATETGLTVIATLHQVEAARTYADRVLGFCRGRMVFDGPPAELGRVALREIFGDMPDQAAPTAPEGAAALGEPQWALS